MGCAEPEPPRGGPRALEAGGKQRRDGHVRRPPPLIHLETAAAELVGGSSTAVIRAPAWLGSLAALVLLALILHERGVRSSAVGIGVVVTAATPMFLVYGTMLDTFVTSLPVALGLLLVWLRALGGKRVRCVTAAVLAAAAVLAGWQAFLVAAAVGGWSLLGLLRRKGPRSVQLAFAGGALGGLCLLVAWLVWAHGGSLRPLVDQYLFRSGASEASPGLADLLDGQAEVLATMFGTVTLVLALAGLGVAVHRDRTRPLAILSLGVTLPYTVLLPLGATNHDYWNYWFLLPVALGLGVGGDWLIGAARTRSRAEPLLAGGAAVLATVLTAGLWLRPSGAQRRIAHGFATGRVVEQGRLPAGQRTAWYMGALGTPARWLAYETRRPAVLVLPKDLERLAADHGDDLVLVGRFSCARGELSRSQAFERASDVARRPPSLNRCAEEHAGPAGDRTLKATRGLPILLR